MSEDQSGKEGPFPLSGERLSEEQKHQRIPCHKSYDVLVNGVRDHEAGKHVRCPCKESWPVAELECTREIEHANASEHVVKNDDELEPVEAQRSAFHEQ